MNYAIQFQDKQFTPNGQVQVTDTDAHNHEVEAKELAWLRTAPDKVFLYVKDGKIGTFLGTQVSTHEHIGPRVQSGFGFHSYRRSVDCRIFGVRYTGWFMESSGDYCRLKKAKRQ